MRLKNHKVTLFSPREAGQQLFAHKQNRNDLCRCGSKKKAKKCCGNQTQYFVDNPKAAKSK